MGTSPPKQNALLSVTLSARMVATAASGALPPDLRTDSPAATAPFPPAATAPFLPLPFHEMASAPAAWPPRARKAATAERIIPSIKTFCDTASLLHGRGPLF